jgi:predicted RNA-binding protein with EMAP domain
MKELEEQANELIEFGNSNEKAKGYGMREVIKAVKQTEIRVYAIDTLNVKKLDWDDLTDEQFMDLAEKEGSVYTLESFTQDFNNSYIDSNVDKIRFISVPVFL